MANAFVDTCALRSAWFLSIVDDLLTKKKVMFIFTRHPKMWEEIKRSELFLRILRNARDSGRLIEVSSDDCEAMIAEIVSLPSWCSCEACDDEHVFALAAICGIDFVFTDDKRIGMCRATIRTVARKYCNFKLIHSQKTYERVREKVITG